MTGEQNHLPMRILHVISDLDPNLGGPPMIAYRLAVAQALLGHHVVLASYASRDAGERTRIAFARVPVSPNFHLHEFPRGGWVESLIAVNARKALRDLVADADVVHLHSVWEPVLVAAAAEARKQNKPYFVLLNGMLDPWSLSQSATKKRIALALVHLRMLNGAAGLHLGNREEQTLITPLNLTPPGIIIPNGVFFEEINPLPEPGTFRKQHPTLGVKPFALFLSRLHYKKGLDYLVDAFALVAEKLADVQLVVAGPDGGAEQDFRARVTELRLDSRVHVIGPVYGDMKYAAMVDAACFCLTSRQEGFSVAVLEALACGTPAVISSACHFDEVEQAHAGRVVPLNATEIAAAITQIVSQPLARQEMSRNAQILIRRRYTWQHIGDLAIAAYTVALNDCKR